MTTKISNICRQTALIKMVFP